MKKIITLGVFFAIFTCMQVTAQIATSNCTSLTVTSDPSYPSDIFGQSIGFKNCTQGFDCCKTVFGTNTWQPRYRLQQQNGSQWINIGITQASKTFANLAHGTYRVQVEIPRYKNEFCTPDGKTPCFNTLGQLVGFWGEWDPTLFFTNEVVVGAAVDSDINNLTNFVDGNGNTSHGPNSFQYLETVRVDATQVRNYDSYAIAIQEFGGANRWHAGPTGGFTSARLGVEDLTALWKTGTPLWEFEPLNSYRLQIVITNSHCPGAWIQTLPVFFICPQGTGCRLGKEDAKISISPNPASNKLKLTNLEITSNVSENYSLTINDLMGKEIKRYTSINENEFDISDLSNGVYVVNLRNKNEGIFNGKLVIAK